MTYPLYALRIYVTGMRKGEAIGVERKGEAPARPGLEWSRVDLEAAVIKLRAADAKTGRVRTIPLNPRMSALLQRQRAGVSTLERERECVIPEVFPDCCPVTLRRWWARSVEAAGLHWLTPQDLRRSFARSATRSGVSEGVTMALLGHRTQAMLDRYNITSTDDLVAGWSGSTRSWRNALVLNPRPDRHTATRRDAPFRSVP